jgi:hypothetical protein
VRKFKLRDKCVKFYFLKKEPDFLQTQSKLFSPTKSPIRDRVSSSFDNTPLRNRDRDTCSESHSIKERLMMERENRKKDIMKNLDIQKFISPYANWMQKELKNL